MVNESGQLYTIEGLASAILMLTTAYLVLSSTTILTPGETHITDLQLEQVGYDSLAVMDIPDQHGNPSRLSTYIQTNDFVSFQSDFLQYLNTTEGDADSLDFSASVWYYSDIGTVQEHPFIGNNPYRQNSVKVTRWVILRDTIQNPPGNPVCPGMVNPGARVVLLEVLIWRN